jgi:ankyrin repeat protein
MDNKEELLYQAIYKNNIKYIRILLKDIDIDPSSDNNNAIQIACREGFINIVKLLLNDKRVDPSDSHNYAICLASEKGDIDIVKLLLNDKRVEPAGFNNQSIIEAYNNNYLDIALLLWQYNSVKKTLKKDSSTTYNWIKNIVLKNKIDSFN